MRLNWAFKLCVITAFKCDLENEKVEPGLPRFVVGLVITPEGATAYFSGASPSPLLRPSSSMPPSHHSHRRVCSFGARAQSLDKF